MESKCERKILREHCMRGPTFPALRFSAEKQERSVWTTRSLRWVLEGFQSHHSMTQRTHTRSLGVAPGAVSIYGNVIEVEIIAM